MQYTHPKGGGYTMCVKDSPVLVYCLLVSMVTANGCDSKIPKANASKKSEVTKQLTTDELEIVALAQQQIDIREPCPNCWAVSADTIFQDGEGFSVTAWHIPAIPDVGIVITFTKEKVLLQYKSFGMP